MIRRMIQWLKDWWDVYEIGSFCVVIVLSIVFALCVVWGLSCIKVIPNNQIVIVDTHEYIKHHNGWGSDLLHNENCPCKEDKNSMEKKQESINHKGEKYDYLQK
jgi:hypothetical protein